MHFDLWLAQGLAWVIGYLDALTPDDWRNLWLVGGALEAVILAWLSYRIMRRALGHSKFRGTWYNERQFAELVQMIEEDCSRGHRVMRHDEMAVLRRWRFGDNKTIGVKGWGYK